MRNRWTLIMFGLMAIVCAGSGAQDREPQGSSWPRGGDAIDRFLESVEVQDPIRHEGLTIFPVTLRRAYDTLMPATFDEAVRSGDLRVEEIGSGRVNAVRVRNEGRRPVFILAGEIMSGSKQDRTAQRDVLVPGRSGWIEVPVYCVEAGRWKMRTERFGAADSMAAPGLRSKAYGGSSQETIWSEVDSLARDLGVNQSHERPLQEVLDNKEIKERVDEILRGLPIPRHRDTIGFVAYDGVRCLGADLFGRSELFEELREKLLRSYIVGAKAYGRGWGGHDAPDAADAANFVARAWSDRCERTRESTPGMGESLRLWNRSEEASGGALVNDRLVIHMSLFADHGRPVPVPMPEPDPMPIPR